MKKSSSRLWLHLASGLLVSAILACNLPGRTTGIPLPGGGATSPSRVTEAEGIVLNGATLDGIRAVTEDQALGPILSIRITNPTSHEVVATIPCGLIFKPKPGSDEQALMVIVEDSATIPASGTAELVPYVVCIESHNSIPKEGSTYEVGTIAAGDLYKLATCLCQDQEAIAALKNPVALVDQIGIQFAVWGVASGETMEDALQSAQSGEGAIGELEQVIGPIADMLASLTQKWLDRCKVQITPQP